MSKVHGALFALLTASAVALVTTAHADAIAAVPAPEIAFGPGEQSTYKVHYLGISAGTAQVTVGTETQQWGQEVWPIVATARTESLFAVYPVNDKFITYWHTESRRTIGNDLFADENRKRRRQRVKLNHGAKTAQVMKQKQGEAEQESTYEIDAGAVDVASAAFAIRSHKLEVGRRVEMPIFTGAKSFIMRADVEEKKLLKTRLGEKEVYKVRIQTAFSGKFQAKRDMFAYFTTDPSHVLMKVEADFLLGTVEAELVEYKPGRQLASRTGG
jgi:hypothetical protein